MTFLLWLPVAIYMAAVFYVSAQSSPPSPGGVPDYILHGVEYFGLAMVTFRAVAGGLPAQVTAARARATMLIVVGYAISDELHQYFVPFRTADVRDVAYDVVGASLALIVCRAWHIIATPNSQIPNQIPTLTTPRPLPPTEIRGPEVATGCRFAIVASRFNETITSGLLAGARAALSAAGVKDSDVRLVHVPGAFEIPVAALRLARTGEFDAIIALGCLIKGDTMHFEYIAAAASQGIMNVTIATGVPVAFGVLTTMTDEQAIVRSAAGDGNKGAEAARAAIEMATLFRRLSPRPAGADV